MLAFERRGTGVPLVFIHAYPLDKSMWEGQIAALGKNFQFIAPDLPGFGESPLLESTSTMECMAKSILDLLDELRVKDKCVFAGLSMGGYVLFQILKLAPERIRALAFVSTKAAGDTAEGRAKRLKNVEILEQKGIEALPDMMRAALFGPTALQSQNPGIAKAEAIMKAQKVAGVCAALRGMADRPDSTSLLSTISVPSLFLSGTEDGIIPTSAMEMMASKTPKSDFRKIEGAGHLLNMEQPAAFNEQFSTFLKRRVL